jgi:3-oxoacyl-[acyl-carrier protein] reductase
MTTETQPIVIVTGSASGMGRACAERFLSEGWRVVAIDREAQDTESDALIPVADIWDERAVSDALTGAIGDAPVAALVHAAGIFPNLESRRFHRRHLPPDLRRQRARHAKMARAASRRMPRGGAILLFASADAFAVSPDQLLYSAAKAAVVSITKSLAVELAGRGIVVNVVAPGWVDTPGTRAGGRLEAGTRSVPLGRAAAPSEIGDWAWHLCRDPGYVTGETLCVSGGIIVR